MKIARIDLKTLVLVTSLVLASNCAFAENISRWRASLYGRSADDTLSNSKVVGIGANLQIERDLGPSLHAKFLGGVALETGSSSSLFTDEFQPSSRLALTEASLRWRLFSPLSATIGALDQSFLKSPVLIAGGTFPAGIAELDLGQDNWVGNLKGQAAIPTGQRLNTKSAGREATPLLFTQTATLGWQDGDNEFGLLRATHFDFQNLTHGMAQDSRFYGNSISGIAAASKFIYKYEGIELGIDGGVPFSAAVSGIFGASFVQNLQGPKSADAARYGYAGIRWRNPSFTIEPKGEWLESQSDSAPAFYTNGEFGHNNRRGFGGSLKVDIKNPGIQLEFRARSSRLIQAQPFQKDKFRFFQLSIGLPYAVF